MFTACAPWLTRRRLLACLAGGVLVPLPVLAQTPDAGMPGFLRIAAGPFDSAAYGVAGSLGNLLSSPPGGRTCERGGSCGVPGLIAVALAAEDAPAALALVAGGQAEAAVVAALHLTGPLAGGVQSVASLYSRDLHVLIRQDDEQRSRLADLKGRRLGICIGSDIETAVPRAVIRHGGLLARGGRAQLLQLRFGLEALIEGEVDALFAMLTPPSALVSEQARTHPLALLSLTAADVPPDLRSVTELHNLPGALYPGMAGGVVLAVPRQLVVRSDLPVAFVEALTTALWHPQTGRALAAAGLPYSDIRPETALQGLVRPLHPGAEKYYREKGLL